MEITECATCRNLPSNDAPRVKINPTGHHVLICEGISGCSLYMRSGNFRPNCQDKYMPAGLWQTVDVIHCDCKQGKKWWSQCSREFWQQKYTQSSWLCSKVNELVKKLWSCSIPEGWILHLGLEKFAQLWIWQQWLCPSGKAAQDKFEASWQVIGLHMFKLERGRAGDSSCHLDPAAFWPVLSCPKVLN